MTKIPKVESLDDIVIVCKNDVTRSFLDRERIEVGDIGERIKIGDYLGPLYKRICKAERGGAIIIDNKLAYTAETFRSKKQVTVVHDFGDEKEEHFYSQISKLENLGENLVFIGKKDNDKFVVNINGSEGQEFDKIHDSVELVGNHIFYIGKNGADKYTPVVDGNPIETLTLEGILPLNELKYGVLEDDTFWLNGEASDDTYIFHVGGITRIFESRCSDPILVNGKIAYVTNYWRLNKSEQETLIVDGEKIFDTSMCETTSGIIEYFGDVGGGFVYAYSLAAAKIKVVIGNRTLEPVFGRIDEFSFEKINEKTVFLANLRGEGDIFEYCENKGDLKVFVEEVMTNFTSIEDYKASLSRNTD